MDRRRLHNAGRTDPRRTHSLPVHTQKETTHHTSHKQLEAGDRLSGTVRQPQLAKMTTRPTPTAIYLPPFGDLQRHRAGNALSPIREITASPAPRQQGAVATVVRPITAQRARTRLWPALGRRIHVGVHLQIIGRPTARQAWSPFGVGFWAECARLCTSLKLMHRCTDWSRRGGNDRQPILHRPRSEK